MEWLKKMINLKKLLTINLCQKLCKGPNKKDDGIFLRNLLAQTFSSLKILPPKSVRFDATPALKVSVINT